MYLGLLCFARVVDGVTVDNYETFPGCQGRRLCYLYTFKFAPLFHPWDVIQAGVPGTVLFNNSNSC